MKFIKKFLDDIRLSNANKVKYSLVVAGIVFVISFISQQFKGASYNDAAIIGGMSAAIFFIVWYFTCFQIVRTMDKKDARESTKKQAEMEERRRNAEQRGNKKVNNKKKKKYRNQND